MATKVEARDLANPQMDGYRAKVHLGERCRRTNKAGNLSSAKNPAIDNAKTENPPSGK